MAEWLKDKPRLNPVHAKDAIDVNNANYTTLILNNSSFTKDNEDGVLQWIWSICHSRKEVHGIPNVHGSPINLTSRDLVAILSNYCRDNSFNPEVERVSSPVVVVRLLH